MVTFREDFGNKKVWTMILSADRLSKRGMRQGWFQLGRDLKSTASNEILHGMKSGQVYIRRDKAGRRRKHRSSAPGETHANRTGATRRSLSWKVRGHQSLEFGYGVVQARSQAQATPYAEFLEFGTPGGRMKARPSLQNAISATTRNAEKYFDKEILKEFK
jgi:HK97 gp10 family phage protein